MDWKRIFPRAAGFGAGFALSLTAILGVAWWYTSRPKPTKPWDTKTIQAEYDGTTEERTTDIGFRYALKNNGSDDYHIGNGDSVQLSIRVGKDGELMPFNRLVSIETIPVFVPSGHKTIVFLKMKTPTRFQHSIPEHPTGAEEEQYRKAVLDYLNSTRIVGFVLFDELHRIEIDFPNGWTKTTAPK
jgi:hypothetical protein